MDLEEIDKLFLLRRLDKPGGAEESLKTLERSFQKNTQLIGYSSNEDSEYQSVNRLFPKRRILPAEMYHFVRYLSAVIRFREPIWDSDAEIIFSQHGPGLAANIWKSEAKNVFFIRDQVFLHNVGFQGSNFITKCFNFVFSKINKRISKYILTNSDLVIANSDFMGEKYREQFGIDHQTIYPFVDLEDYKVEQTGNKILHVNPDKSKGIELTLDVAEKMPKEEFIIAGETSDQDIRNRIDSLENVELLGYLEDMKKAYSEAKIVLMPSKWEEPYGRIPIEAGASGIPTIATSNGGLPESVGNEELLVDSENPAKFVEKIKEVKENQQEFSEKSRKNAQGKSQQKQLGLIHGNIGGI